MDTGGESQSQNFSFIKNRHQYIVKLDADPENGLDAWKCGVCAM